MEKTIYERMGGTHLRHGDYLIPSLALPAEKETRQIGVWGQRHLQYLKEYRKDVYLELLTGGRLNDYLADIDEQAQECFEGLVEQLKQTQGITEQLKTKNALEWIRRINNIHMSAREFVEKEIIFA